MTRQPKIALAVALLGLHLVAGTVSADQPTEAAERQAAHFFETKVRPILAQHCFNCHGPREQKSDLRLDRRDHFFLGGAGGPIVEAGNLDESTLIQAVRWEGYEMPPEKQLPDADIAVLEKWVATGAYWP